VIEPGRGAVVGGLPGAHDSLQEPEGRRDRHHHEQRGENPVAVRGPGQHVGGHVQGGDQ
jgi:hypothetical protein